MFILFLNVALASDLIAANTQSMGGVGVANPSSNAAIDLNPGVLALRRRYDLAGYGDLGGAQRARNYGLNAMDSRTTRVALGFAYEKQVFEPPFTDSDMPGWLIDGQPATNKKTAEFIQTAIGISFLNDRLSVGISGQVAHWKTDRSDPFWAPNLGVGLGATLSPSLTAGLSATHLLPTAEPSAAPTRVMSGLYFEKRSVNAEVNAGFTRKNGVLQPAIRAGLEGQIQSVTLRGGYALRQSKHQLAFGFSLGSNNAFVDYGLQVPLQLAGIGDLIHHVGFRVIIPQSGVL